ELSTLRPICRLYWKTRLDALPWGTGCPGWMLISYCPARYSVYRDCSAIATEASEGIQSLRRLVTSDSIDDFIISSPLTKMVSGSLFSITKTGKGWMGRWELLFMIRQE